MNRRPQLRIVASAATPEEAAAIVAALERYMRDTSPTPAPRRGAPSAWARAARLEATRHAAGDSVPWGVLA